MRPCIQVDYTCRLRIRKRERLCLSMLEKADSDTENIKFKFRGPRWWIRGISWLIMMYLVYHFCDIFDRQYIVGGGGRRLSPKNGETGCQQAFSGSSDPQISIVRRLIVDHSINYPCNFEKESASPLIFLNWTFWYQPDVVNVKFEIFAADEKGVKLVKEEQRLFVYVYMNSGDLESMKTMD